VRLPSVEARGLGPELVRNMPAVQTFSLAVEGTPAFAQYLNLKELIEGAIWPDSDRPSSTLP
jgi:hypothetical protein